MCGAVRQRGELSRRAVPAGDGLADALSGGVGAAPLSRRAAPAPPGVRVVAAARQALGARFRLHGREPASGLDCVGLAAWALGGGGFAGCVPDDYALRGGAIERVVAAIDACGLARVEDEAAGDLLLCRSGPGQWHLAIRSERGVIHADALLRRVVERPGRAPWPVIGRWRLVRGE